MVGNTVVECLFVSDKLLQTVEGNHCCGSSEQQKAAVCPENVEAAKNVLKCFCRDAPI